MILSYGPSGTYRKGWRHFRKSVFFADPHCQLECGLWWRRHDVDRRQPIDYWQAVRVDRSPQKRTIGIKANGDKTRGRSGQNEERSGRAKNCKLQFWWLFVRPDWRQRLSDVCQAYKSLGSFVSWPSPHIRVRIRIRIRVSIPIPIPIPTPIPIRVQSRGIIMPDNDSDAMHKQCHFKLAIAATVNFTMNYYTGILFLAISESTEKQKGLAA